jgi:hypothetical protein
MGYRHYIERVEGMARPPYSAARSGGLGSRGVPCSASGGRIRSSASAFVQCFPGRAFLRSRMPTHVIQAEVGAMVRPNQASALCQRAITPSSWAYPKLCASIVRGRMRSVCQSACGSAGPSPGLLPRQDTNGPTGPRRGNSWRGRCPVEGTGRASSPVAGRAAIIRRFAGEGAARCRPVTSFCLEGTG